MRDHCKEKAMIPQVFVCAKIPVEGTGNRICTGHFRGNSISFHHTGRGRCKSCTQSPVRTERPKMNNDNNPKAYPCDEPDQKPSYPCDTEETFFDSEKQPEAADTAVPKKGKGKRGGNAAASVVVHSGKFRTPPRTEKRESFGDRPAYERGGYKGRNDRRDYDRSGRDRNDRPKKEFDRRGTDSRNRHESASDSAFSRAYTLRVTTVSEIGAFVEAPAEVMNGRYGKRSAESTRVLIPFAEQIGRPAAGDTVTVYFYEDKGGRLTATMRTPILKDGEVGILEVAAVTSIGAFLDNGVPKQVLLPFKEQIHRPEVGDEVLVWLYKDKSGRQAATMRVYGHLDRHSPYHEDDRVTGFVYEINPDLGIFVAVDNKYYGLVPIRETFKNYAYGDEVEARVAKVREDGKLDLLIRDKLYKTVQEDADVILYELRRNNGFLPYGDRADAVFIEETYAMSKNQFKRALGHLYKNHIVELDRENDTVRLLKN